MTSAIPSFRRSRVTRVIHAAFSAAFAGLAVTGTQIELHKHWLPRAGLIHELFGLLLIASSLAYVAYGLRSGGLRGIWFGEEQLRGVVPMSAYYLRLRDTAPAYEGYNPLQRLAYTAAMLIITPLLIATGAALFFHAKAATVWHVGFAIELALFFCGHVFMVAATKTSDVLSPCRRPDTVLRQSRRTETPARFDRVPQK